MSAYVLYFRYHNDVPGKNKVSERCHNNKLNYHISKSKLDVRSLKMVRFTAGRIRCNGNLGCGKKQQCNSNLGCRKKLAKRRARKQRRRRRYKRRR